MNKAASLAFLVVILGCSFLVAQEVHKVVIQLSATEGLLIQSTAPITSERVPIQQPGGESPPTTPGPGPNPPDPSTIEQRIRLAKETIPQYPARDQHCQQTAFTITFLAQGIGGNESADPAREHIKTATDAILGTDASKWGTFWSSFNTITAGQTGSQYAESLRVCADVLTEHIDSAQGGDTFQGVPTFGLEQSTLESLFQILLPILLQLLQSFFNQ